MTDIYDKIKETAEELTEMIKKCEIYIEYINSIKTIKNDKKSRELLEKLIIIGRDLNEKKLKGKNIIIESSNESEIIKKELNSDDKIKKHLIIQKKYLNMMSMIIERLKNPLKII